MSCSRAQCSDAGEDRTSSPSVSSQALKYWTTALSMECVLIWASAFIFFPKRTFVRIVAFSWLSMHFIQFYKTKSRVRIRVFLSFQNSSIQSSMAMITILFIVWAHRILPCKKIVRPSQGVPVHLFLWNDRRVPFIPQFKILIVYNSCFINVSSLFIPDFKQFSNLFYW